MGDAAGTVKMARNLEGNDQRSSKMWIGPSTTKRCGGRIYKDMAATYRPGHGQFQPLPGGYSSSLCIACDSSFSSCYTIRCVTTKRCTSVNGSPMTCTSSENCERIP
ncbi:unnamed protein product [Arabis nemorensis]|uniref:Uncharacterized protein n=1 Tax=Arabis nemorensis TaxID=586526 RepID=A0A565BRB0_9BRAS|nr:unnamed protein product [Arabis nemorensis]